MNREEPSPEGRPVAVVTGAAKGIGRAIAERLGSDGWALVLWDVLGEGAAVAARLREQDIPARFEQVDVSDEEAIFAAISSWPVGWRKVRGLVNNAGIFPRVEALSMSSAVWNRVLAVNLTGAFLCSRALAPLILAQGQGAIVNLASGRAYAGAKLGCAYAASKAGIVGLTRSLALEWAPAIRVNCVVPGVTDTDQPREAGIDDATLYARGASIPLGRIGRPDDVAKGVAFLLGPDAEYITGQALFINGGALMG